ncbi:hypothetical protein L6452_35750 [Arctium lappa]|uniref:Uncharacterized protein n=1 Tax=Arctium lappa TaxID=4217 RepID=A0ACB8Y7B4_ARCLA|nr:hypothetical protein L6452_35750 [Arctium lappa]
MVAPTVVVSVSGGGFGGGGGSAAASMVVAPAVVGWIEKDGVTSGLGKGSVLVEGSRLGKVTQEQLDEFESFSDDCDYSEGDDERDHYNHSEDEDCDYINEEDDITNDEDMMNFHMNTDRELEWIGRTDPDNPVADVEEEALDFSDDQSCSDEDDYELKRNQHLRQIRKIKWCKF